MAGGRENFDGVGNALSGAGRDKYAVAAVMLWSVAQIPSVLSVDGPRAAFFWGFMHGDASAQRSNWGAVEIEGTIEVRFGREKWM